MVREGGCSVPKHLQISMAPDAFLVPEFWLELACTQYNAGCTPPMNGVRLLCLCAVEITLRQCIIIHNYTLYVMQLNPGDAAATTAAAPGL